MPPAISLTDGTTTLDLLDTDGNGYEIKEEGIRAMTLPRENTRFVMTLSISGSTAALLWANYATLRQMLLAAEERSVRKWRPIHELSYQPDGATSASKKYVYGFSIRTSPFEASVFARSPTGSEGGGRHLRNLQIELVVEPFWRGASEHALLKNLCDNSDFEWDVVGTAGSSVTGWTALGIAGTSGTGVVTTNVKYGARAYRYVQSATVTATSGLEQDVTIVASSGPYSISAWCTPTTAVAQLYIHNGSGGNFAFVNSSGTGLQELKIENYDSGSQTTIAIRLMRSTTTASDTTWDSVYLKPGATMPKGYISGHTFDTLDSTLMERNGSVIVAGLEGDVPPLMRIALENTGTTEYKTAYIGTRKVEPGVVTLPYIMQATAEDADGSNVNVAFVDTNESGVSGSPSTAQPDLQGRHIEGNNAAAINTTLICALSSALSTATPTEATDPSISIRPHRYEVYARLATTVKLLSFRVMSDSDVVLAERRNVPVTGDSGKDLEWVHIDTCWIPSTHMVNNTDTATAYPMYVLWDNGNDGTADTKLDFIAFFPSDESFCILDQERSLSAAWNQWEWASDTSKWLVLENITDPGRRHFQSINDATTYHGVAGDPTKPGTHAHWRFHGDWPVLWPNVENQMYVWVMYPTGTYAKLAILDQQFRAEVHYVPRFLAPRGD